MTGEFQNPALADRPCYTLFARFCKNRMSIGVSFKTGVKISSAPTGRRRKLIFGGGALPRRQKSIKERHLYDSRLIFAPKLKRTLSIGGI
jgi:hypothetical protein